MQALSRYDAKEAPTARHCGHTIGRPADIPSTLTLPHEAQANSCNFTAGTWWTLLPWLAKATSAASASARIATLDDVGLAPLVIVHPPGQRADATP
jgi:hypothetical protein